jgi:hypothetical protein
MRIGAHNEQIRPSSVQVIAQRSSRVCVFDRQIGRPDVVAMASQMFGEFGAGSAQAAVGSDSQSAWQYMRP